MKPRLLWLGNPFFAHSLSSEDWEVCIHSDFTSTSVFEWHQLIEIAGWEPHVLVVADKSTPPFVVGMEHFPCLTLFYAIDTHIHSWYPFYAQAFDGCLISLKDHLQAMEQRLTADALLWSPPFALDLPETKTLSDCAPLKTVTETQWDCLFVGTVNPETTPQRVSFLQDLAKHIPLHVTSGNYLELYPHAKIVLNYCERGDLNFRVFEALGCGSCLITPHVEHGFSELFTAGEDLLVYPVEELDAVVHTIRHALQNPTLCQKIAQQGLHTINTHHRAHHRAQTFTDFARRLMQNNPVPTRLQQAGSIHNKYLHLLYLHLAETTPSEILRQTYLRSSQRLFKG